jgi:hypothetical protein
LALLRLEIMEVSQESGTESGFKTSEEEVEELCQTWSAL